MVQAQMLLHAFGGDTGSHGDQHFFFAGRHAILHSRCDLPQYAGQHLGLDPQHDKTALADHLCVALGHIAAHLLCQPPGFLLCVVGDQHLFGVDPLAGRLDQRTAHVSRSDKTNGIIRHIHSSF